MSVTETPAKHPHVIAAIAAVMAEMPPVGKNQQMTQSGAGNYRYRGIEDITAAIQHLMGRHGVIPVPRVESSEVENIEINGKPWTVDKFKVVYRLYGPGGIEDFIDAGPFIGYARDNSDKGSNKAMTQVFKQMLVQVFVVGENNDDPDSYAAQERDQRRAEFQPMAQIAPMLARLTAESRLALSDWRKAEQLPAPSEMNPEQTALTLAQMGVLIATQDADGEIPADAPPSPHPAAVDPDEAPFERTDAVTVTEGATYRNELDSLYASQGKAALIEEVTGADDRYIDYSCTLRGIEGPLLRDQLIQFIVDAAQADMAAGSTAIPGMEQDDPGRFFDDLKTSTELEQASAGEDRGGVSRSSHTGRR